MISVHKTIQPELLAGRRGPPSVPRLVPSSAADLIAVGSSFDRVAGHDVPVMVRSTRMLFGDIPGVAVITYRLMLSAGGMHGSTPDTEHMNRCGRIRSLVRKVEPPAQAQRTRDRPAR